jgi:mono/diheme cytochrome c family protein
MRLFLSLLIGSWLSILSASSWAQSEVQIFAAELLRLESRQMLSPGKVLRYSDGDEGAALKKLLDPQRANRVIATYAPAVATDGETRPDLASLLKTLLARYEKAFADHPQDYEVEYLDALNWGVLLLLRSSASIKESTAQDMSSSKVPPFDSNEMVEALNRLMDAVKHLLAKGIYQKIDAGVFSPSGAKRALDYAQRVTSLIQEQAPRFEWRTRVAASGESVYKNQCAACHASGAAGAPRFRDIEAWLPRIRSGFANLLASAMNGKGVMAPQRGGDFLDFEIERAVVYMANSAGGRFSEPAVPPGQETPIRYQIRINPIEIRPPSLPYSAMDFDARLKFGEKVYLSNCIACHQTNGKGVGPFPSLLNAKSLESNESAISVLLNGGSNGRMPSWKRLRDEEIASVINYMRNAFGAYVATPVTPEAVRGRR